LRASDLKRAEVAAASMCGNTEKDLHQLQENVCTELQFWENELQQRQNVVKEKTKFEDFYRKQMSKEKQNHGTGVGRRSSFKGGGNGGAGETPNGMPRRKSNSIARQKKGKAFENKLAGMQAEAEIEEKRFEDAFRAIGIRLDEFSPNHVINSCLYLETMHKDLDAKLEDENEKLANLKATEEHLQKALRNQLFTSERTTNRTISVQEDKLAELQKTVGREKAQYVYILDVIRPVKIGIQNLVKRVLNVTIDPEDIDVVEKSMHLVVQKLKRLSAETLGLQEGEGLKTKKSATSVRHVSPQGSVSSSNADNESVSELPFMVDLEDMTRGKALPEKMKVKTSPYHPATAKPHNPLNAMKFADPTKLVSQYNVRIQIGASASGVREALQA